MKGYLSSSEFAKAVGVHPNTVRNWDRNNYLKPAIVIRGRRYYAPSQVNDVVGIIESGTRPAEGK